MQCFRYLFILMYLRILFFSIVGIFYRSGAYYSKMACLQISNVVMLENRKGF